MNGKKTETTTYQTNRLSRKTRQDVEFRTEEQFTDWLEKSLAELEANHSDFATTESNRKYFSR